MGRRLSRRRFLVTGAAAAGALATGARPASAGAAKPRARYGDLRDVQHVIVLMQENRSFDHYFGTLRGVRGFGDRSTVTLPGGRSVFQQPLGSSGDPSSGTQFPWRLSEAPASAYPPDNQPPDSATGAQNSVGTAHSWSDQHSAWRHGWMDGWLAAKTLPVTLGYLTRADIPFHYALADAYTVGDAYHCSVLGATGPNRTCLWSGTVNGQLAEAGQNLSWETYAETLQAAGVSWKVYQCVDHAENNALEYFKSFAAYDPAQNGTPAPGNPLYDRGVATVPEPTTGVSANADNLAAAIRADVSAGTLPRVSWVVAAHAFNEHPEAAPDNGAYLVNGILQALNADPAVLNSTVVIVNYDENDGYFDHVPPPSAPRGTQDEWLGNAPLGLGFRVPLILISPWTRGGWVTSEVADHTSIIQFLEAWTTALGTPALCVNISGWRRQVCGDLTRAFDFAAPVYGLPDLPSTTAAPGPPNGAYHPPPASNSMPRQDPGVRPARPLPYQPNANLDGMRLHDDVTLHALLSLSNSAAHAARACHFSVYDNVGGTSPRQYTINPDRSGRGHATRAAVDLGTLPQNGDYDITVLGPNRFLRRFAGNITNGDTTSQVRLTITSAEGPALEFDLFNHAFSPVTFTIRQSYYSTGTDRVRVRPNRHGRFVLRPPARSKGWYDVTVTVSEDSSWSRRYVGHVETGRPSVTGS